VDEWQQISGEAAQHVLQALQHNNTLQWLVLPHYTEDIKKRMKLLEEEVHKERKSRGCQTKLNIIY